MGLSLLQKSPAGHWFSEQLFPEVGHSLTQQEPSVYIQAYAKIRLSFHAMDPNKSRET